MASIIQQITLDFSRENNVIVNAKRDDAGSRFLNVKFTNLGVPVLIAADSVVTINIVKSDGLYVASAGVVEEDGTVTVPLTNQALAVDGNAKADISIISAETSKLTTLQFTIRVQQWSVPDDTIVSTDEFGVLTTALAEVAGFAGVKAEVEGARGTFDTVELRLDEVDTDIAAIAGRVGTAEDDILALDDRLDTAETKTASTDIELNALTQAISQQGSPYLSVDGYGTLSLPKNAAQAAMQSEVEGNTITPLVAQSAVAISGTVNFNSVLNNKYYDFLHKTILTGTGSAMTITNDTAAIADIMAIDLTAHGLETLTAAQCQAAFPAFFTGTKSSIIAREVGVNKNITTYKTFNDFKNNNDGSIGANYYAKTIKVFPNTNYTFSCEIKNAIGINVFIYIKGQTDSFMALSSTGIKKATATSTSAGEISIGIHKAVETNYHQENDIKNIQLEAGTVATTYEPFKSTQRYNEPSEYYRLPNGVCDYRDKQGNKRVRTKRYVLTADDVISLVTSGTNTDYFTLKKPLDSIFYNTQTSFGTIPQGLIVPGFRLGNYADSVDAINVISALGAPTYFVCTVAKGTYANLAAAKAALAGTVIYYQLAADKEYTIPQVSSGILNSYPNGTYYIDYAVTDAGVYTDKANISRTAYPIKEIESLYKYNADGTLTQLTVSSAVIAADKLSFTHSGLANNDVWFGVLKFDAAAPLPNAKLSPIDNKSCVQDSVVPTKWYQIGFAVADGVISLTKTEV